ncbi:YhgE/Pip domain-containing protein [Bacillus marasmi]|uniref:YhgE/Pip domain-containing protein n=1 Tax=Bacillus marasmi TaxID=1926279 RepID=UPI0011CC2665|nr:ABC transporter permease [Bacillus marasmi]
MGGFFKNKMVWLGLGGIILLASVLTFAFMGSTINSTPKKMPLAIVVEDEGVQLANGKQMNLGEALIKDIQKEDSPSVKWKLLKSKQSALSAMDEKKFYAVIIIQRDFTRDVLSQVTNKPTIPTATIIMNEGMNPVGASVALQIANGVVTQFSKQITIQLSSLMAELNIPITPDLAKTITEPFKVDTVKRNPVGTNNANGNTPALFTQILWLVTFISSMMLFTIRKKGPKENQTAWSLVSQILAGTLYVSISSGGILILAVRVLGVSVPNEGDLFMLLVLIGLCFFLIQNALLMWIGYLAAPIIILLFFFSAPILTMAPEMLPEFTRDYLYSWIPFRFSVESFKDLLFFKKGPFESGMVTLGVSGLISLCMIGLSILKPVKKGSFATTDQSIL